MNPEVVRLEASDSQTACNLLTPRGLMLDVPHLFSTFALRCHFESHC